jgi:hypothetical protein
MFDIKDAGIFRAEYSDRFEFLSFLPEGGKNLGIGLYSSILPSFFII